MAVLLSVEAEFEVSLFVDGSLGIGSELLSDGLPWFELLLFYVELSVFVSSDV